MVFEINTVRKKMNDLQNDVKKYESELGEINKRLQALDDERTKLVRIGVRIEGALAYIQSKIREEGEAKVSAEPASA
jgi:chromosome segregation ATPase